MMVPRVRRRPMAPMAPMAGKRVWVSFIVVVFVMVVVGSVWFGVGCKMRCREIR